jgi:hypothetical protein
MNDFVQHQQVIELAGVSVGIAHQEEGSPKHPPKFSIGDEVIWAYVKAHDYGVIVDRLWTTGTVHKVTGWHYLVGLHPNSFSYSFCQEDWAYEQDLELLSEFKLQGGEPLE